jgi:hypothetical protein
MTSRLERIRKLMDAPPEAPMLDEILRGFEVYLRLKARQDRRRRESRAKRAAQIDPGMEWAHVVLLLGLKSRESKGEDVSELKELLSGYFRMRRVLALAERLSAQ